MSHPLLDKLAQARSDILWAEVAALLHDIGKLRTEFVQAKSDGWTGREWSHAQEVEIHGDFRALWGLLEQRSSHGIKVSHLVRYHHLRRDRDRPVGCLLRLLQACDGRDSFDEKGPERYLGKQPPSEIAVANSFGVERPSDPASIGEAGVGLVEAVERWLSAVGPDPDFQQRDELLRAYRTYGEQGLGETRRPSNDVTLWDHSYSVAALYKTMLASRVLCGQTEFERIWQASSPISPETPRKEAPGDGAVGNEQTPKADAFVQWRIFGVAWNGRELVSHCSKIADSTARVQAIAEWKSGVRRLLEWEFPVGNCVYEDLDGIYFTFPGLNGNQDVGLAREAAQMVLSLREGDVPYTFLEETTPIFSLSEPSRSMTVIAREWADNLAETATPHRSARLRWRSSREEGATWGDVGVFQDQEGGVTPTDNGAQAGGDRCPVCNVRRKPESDDLCAFCLNRRKGRLDRWWGDADSGGTTIWLDEVADSNNMLALLVIRLDPYHWLNGSQYAFQLMGTPGDWTAAWGTHAQKVLDASQLDQCRLGAFRDWTKGGLPSLQLLRDLYDSRWEYRYRVSSERLPSTSPDLLANSVVQKAPCPGRLRRLWGDLERLTEDVELRILGEMTASSKPSRLVWQLSGQARAALPSGSKPVDCQLRWGDGRRCSAVWLPEEGVLVSTGGLPAAMPEGSLTVSVAGGEAGSAVSLDTEELHRREQPYIPAVPVFRTAVELQMIVPADRVVSLLRSCEACIAAHMAPAVGKLPVHVGVLFFKHRYPLYAVLRAADQLFPPVPCADVMAWTVDETDPQGIAFTNACCWPASAGTQATYRCYPTLTLQHEVTGLDLNGNDCSIKTSDQLGTGDQVQVTPSYFDFAYLRGLTDAADLHYTGAADGKPIRELRPDVALNLIRARRPYFREQLPRLLNLLDAVGELSNGVLQVVALGLRKAREWDLPGQPGAADALAALVKAAVLGIRAETDDQKTARRRLADCDFASLLDAVELWKAAVRREPQ